MLCDEARELIDAYADGELDLVSSLEIEKHLRTCQECSLAYRNRINLRAAIIDARFRFEPPKDLQKRVRSAVQRESKEALGVASRVRRWIFVAAPLAAAAIVLLIFSPTFFRRSSDELLTREVIAGHARSLMANHLTDVASSDQHTVKPWLDRRLDFAPPVKDLAAQGFPLIGGRLDYLDNHPVAALVYQRRQHFINLYIWSTPNEADAKQRTTARQGYTIIHWSAAGLTYWAVTDINADDLKEFVQLFQSAS